MANSATKGTLKVGKISFSGGGTFSFLTTAITTNVTTTTEPQGSLAVTKHATGLGHLFYSDGAKWQQIA